MLKSVYESRGRHCGYPPCCIENFVKGNQPNVDFNSFLGFVPCPVCYDLIESGKIHLNDLIKDRKCLSKFPDCECFDLTEIVCTPMLPKNESCAINMPDFESKQWKIIQTRPSCYNDFEDYDPKRYNCDLQSNKWYDTDDIIYPEKMCEHGCTTGIFCREFQQNENELKRQAALKGETYKYSLVSGGKEKNYIRHVYEHYVYPYNTKTKLFEDKLEKPVLKRQTNESSDEEMAMTIKELENNK